MRPFLLLLILLCTGATAAAAYEHGMSAIPAAGPYFVAGRWMPLDIKLSNNTNSPTRGEVELRVEINGQPVILRQEVVVPSKSTARYNFLSQFAKRPDAGDARPRGTPATVEADLFWRVDGKNIARETVSVVPDTDRTANADDASNTDESRSRNIADTERGENRRNKTTPSDEREETRFDIGGIVAGLTFVQFPDDATHDPAGLITRLGSVLPYPITPSVLRRENSPDRAVELDALRLIFMSQSAVSALSPPQQQALLVHIQSGGTLVLCDVSRDIDQCWLYDELPMDIVGQRELVKVEADDSTLLPLVGPTACLELAPRPDAKVTANLPGDSSVAMAGYREVGRGRIVMTGFPVNALTASSASARFWKLLINSDSPAFHDRSLTSGNNSLITELSADRAANREGRPFPSDRAGSISADATTHPPASVADVLRSLIGAAAPSWRSAAILVGLYVTAVIALLAFTGMRRRPMAVLACLAVSAVMTTVVVAAVAMRGHEQPTTVARISVVDLSNGVRTSEEWTAFYGQTRDGISADFSRDTLVSPLLATGPVTPVVQSSQAKITDISTGEGALRSVWKLRTLARPAAPADAVLRFTSTGASLHTRTGLASTLLSPKLIFGRSVFALEDLAAAGNTVVDRAVPPVNPPGSYAARDTLLANDLSRTRENLLRALFEVTENTSPMSELKNEPLLVLAGFADTDLSDAMTLPPDVVQRTMSLVRQPVTIEPIAAGTEVRIDPGFVQIKLDAAPTLLSGFGGGMPASNQSGEWLIGLAPPAGIGRVLPKTLLLSADVQLTNFDLSLRVDQCRDGRVAENRDGRPVLTYTSGGQQQATVDLTPGDIDANGWVWLLLSVSGQPLGPSATGVMPSQDWRMVAFSPTIVATTSADATPPRVTWPNRIGRPTEAEPDNTAHKPAQPKRPQRDKPKDKAAHASPKGGAK